MLRAAADMGFGGHDVREEDLLFLQQMTGQLGVQRTVEGLHLAEHVAVVRTVRVQYLRHQHPEPRRA